MPKYFFHMRLGADFVDDIEGRDLPDADAARDEAIASVKEVVAYDLLDGYTLSTALNGLIEVKDETGRPIFFMPFTEAAEAPSNE